MSLLSVRDLKITFNSGSRKTQAVRGISFDINDGDSVAIVGESGSGKTITSLSFTRLLPKPPVCEISGKILLNGRDILKMSPSGLRKIRGAKIAYVFQEASASLNPVFTIGSQIAEAVRIHMPEEKDVRGFVVKMLEQVGIRDANLRYDAYPHELSGGMQQRAMIAMALSCAPSLLVADEPTTALDVTIQKQIIDLLKSVHENRKMSLILITHNFGIISSLCEKVMVMFRGQIVESGYTKDVLKNPQHPYTKALIACVPRLGHKHEKLVSIDYENL
ncbi:MAG: ABC transporter ATP-binding protein [Opitutales bacterium]|nr:ABC transporter ATP-binding protein [Opitutales bacterium]